MSVPRTSTLYILWAALGGGGILVLAGIYYGQQTQVHFMQLQFEWTAILWCILTIHVPIEHLWDALDGCVQPMVLYVFEQL